jgi:hypothetical protein
MRNSESCDCRHEGGAISLCVHAGAALESGRN